MALYPPPLWGCPLYFRNEMKEKPILFSGPMVKAILEGRKTKTRRVFKTQPEYRENESVPGSFGTFFYGWNLDHPAVGINDIIKYCPYGFVGDRLWVKETFYALGEWFEISAGSNRFTFHRCKMSAFPSLDMPVTFLDKPPEQIETARIPGIVGWYKRPSIFLPRKDSRINLENTEIRVERLQDITREDAKAEGITEYLCDFTESEFTESQDDIWRNRTTVENFRALWDSINGKPRADGIDISWDANPWVWAVSFKVVK